MTTEVDNRQDIIDSRDIIERVDDLRAGWMAGEGNLNDLSPDGDYELGILEILVDEADVSPDWIYGETLIRDSYFTEYAQELADDLCLYDRDYDWPHNFIDWDAAAEALHVDYFDVDFDGVTYWIRG